ncbi:N-acyl homoserine lactonase family protein [Amycolatopsis mediterranei]|uniref:N-acyl homoserine lactonase family protein n=1 Tax=Amycolatopsis mediterranei TaxID=33910 RepID=UPI00343B5818
MTAPEPDWRVFAIRYAEREGVAADEVFLHATPSDEPRTMAYYLWLVTGPAGVFLVDTGFGCEVARLRDREDCLRGDPLDAVRALGVPPEELADVVLTHLHFDHCGELDRFPRARFWLQQREMAFWTGPNAQRPSFRRVVMSQDITAVAALNLDGRIRWVDGDVTIAPGLSLHHVGGHTAGMQVVRVVTGHGVVVLASDAAHYYANLAADRPYSALESVSGAHAAFDRLRELAGPAAHIVPGHDPAVLTRYPVAGPHLAGTAVELTAGPLEPEAEKP